jgi:hypothetical protein
MKHRWKFSHILFCHVGIAGLEMASEKKCYDV